MSDFRDDIVERLVLEAHPDVVFQILMVLRNAVSQKVIVAEDCEPQVPGLVEARALLSNLMVDLHQVYGVPTPAEEEEKEEENAEGV